MRLTISPEETRRLLLSIPHERCVKAIDRNWRVQSDGSARAQSILWLFCWAKTGMNSEIAREAAVRVFDRILPVTFAHFSLAIDHEWARWGRYALGNIERELNERLVR